MAEHNMSGKGVGTKKMGTKKASFYLGEDDDDDDTEVEETREEEEDDEEDEDEEEVEEEDMWEGVEPLELGGFMTPLLKNAFPSAPTDTFARDLAVGHVVLFRDRACEIVGKTNTLAQSGPLASRHTIALDLIELFDKEALTPFVVKAKDKLALVKSARVRYTVVCVPPNPPSSCSLSTHSSALHLLG